jgi:hypothetical protein
MVEFGRAVPDVNCLLEPGRVVLLVSPLSLAPFLARVRCSRAVSMLFPASFPTISGGRARKRSLPNSLQPGFRSLLVPLDLRFSGKYEPDPWPITAGPLED